MAFNWKNLFRIQSNGAKTIDEAITYDTLLSSYTSQQAGEAQALTAYARGVQAIAEAVAQVHFEVYETRDNGHSYRTDSKLNYLLNTAPNNYQNAFDFWRSIQETVLYRGNCFVEIKRESDSTPKELHIIRSTTRPAPMFVDLGQDGVQLFWKFTEDKGDALPDRDLLHFKTSGFNEDLLGNDPLVQYAKALRLSGNTEAYANNVYERNGNISVVLTTEKALTDEQMGRLKSSWTNRYSGRDGDATVVLEEGMGLKSIQITPDQAKFLENRKFQIQEVARILGVPTPVLMDYSDYNYNTAETADLDFYKRSISPKVDYIEKELTKKLLSSRKIKSGKRVKGDVRPLFRADMETRMKYLQDRFSVGSITPNQIRMSEGDEPIEGNPAMDKTYIMSNLAPSDKIETFYEKGEKVDKDVSIKKEEDKPEED